MLATLLIVFREMIEAGLVVGIVMAATRGVSGRGRYVGIGISAGVLAACVVAALASTIGSAMEGAGQEWFNVGILGLAVLMLIWHNVWMASHGREIVREMKALGAAVSEGSRSMAALAVVIGLAVMREGSEVVLFLYGIIISSQESALSMLSGGVFGVIAGVAMSTLMYLGLIHIPSRHLFKVTGILIALLAAGMAAQAVSLLQQAQAITLWSNVLWDSSHVLSQSSIFGEMIHVLIGYTDRPTGMQLAVYVVTLVVMYGLTKLFEPSPKPLPQAA